MDKTQRSTFELSSLLGWMIGLSVLAGCLLWWPNVRLVLEQRRFWLLTAGELSVVYLLLRPKFQASAKITFLVAAIVIANFISLLHQNSFKNAFLGFPVVHSGMLSLLSALAVALVFSMNQHKRQLWLYIYAVLVAFGIANLLYWITHGHAERLGVIGIQINYSALLFLIGLVIGTWLLLRQVSWWLYGSQAILLLALLLTQSRVEILLGLIVILVSCIKLTPGRLRLAVGAGIVLIGCISLLSFSRLRSPSYFATSWRYRVHLIQASLPTQPSRLLLGGGVGSLEENIQTNGQRFPDLRHDIQGGWHFESSHNYLVDLLVERGVIVLSLFVWLNWLAIARALQSKHHNWLLLSIYACTLGFLLFDNNTMQTELILWCCLLGLSFRQSKTTAYL